MAFLSIVSILVVAIGLGAACPPPTLPPGGKWVANQGCTNGGVYFTTNPRQRCHCWGKCGYVCEPSSGGGGSGGSGGSQTTTKKPGSPCPFGGIWYNNKGQRCRCQSFNQQPYYLCEDPTTTSTTTTSTTTVAGATGSDGTTSSGSTSSTSTSTESSTSSTSTSSSTSSSTTPAAR